MNKTTTTRHRSRRPLCMGLLALTLISSGVAAQAQSSNSWVPFTSRGYIGINVGKPSYANSCGVNGTFNCDNPKAAFNLYTGGMLNDYLGLELGYVNMGTADRGGGTTNAQGLNLNLMGRLPLGGSNFSVFGKGGTTFSRTRVSADITSGLATGTDHGWGGFYAAGLGYNVSKDSTVVLEWQNHSMSFVDGRHDVRSTSLGFVQRF